MSKDIKKQNKRERRNEKLETIALNTIPEVLLLGNGLNRLLDLPSWKNLVENFNNNSGNGRDTCLKPKQKVLEQIPLTLQINYDRYSRDHKQILKDFLKDINKSFEEKYSEKCGQFSEKIKVYSEICNMNFDSILTTNYDKFVERFICNDINLGL